MGYALQNIPFNLQLCKHKTHFQTVRSWPDVIEVLWIVFMRRISY